MKQRKSGVCSRGSLLILGLTAATLLAAAEPRAEKDGWDNLRELALDQKIKVVLKNMKAYEGGFQDVNDQRIVVRTAAGEQSVPRETVLRVSVKTGGHRARNAGIGALGGVGAGIGIGAAASKGSEVPAFIYLISIPVSLGVGVAVGAALPSGGWREVYRAR